VASSMSTQAQWAWDRGRARAGSVPRIARGLEGKKIGLIIAVARAPRRRAMTFPSPIVPTWYEKKRKKRGGRFGVGDFSMQTFTVNISQPPIFLCAPRLGRTSDVQTSLHDTSRPLPKPRYGTVQHSVYRCRLPLGGSAAAVGRGRGRRVPLRAAAALPFVDAVPVPPQFLLPPPAGPQPDPCAGLRAPSLQAPSARQVSRSVTLKALWQSSGRTGQMAANGFSRRIANPRVAPIRKLRHRHARLLERACLPVCMRA